MWLSLQILFVYVLALPSLLINIYFGFRSDCAKPSSFIFSQAFSSMATVYTHSLMDATPATHTCFVYRLPYTVQFLNFELSRKIVSNINQIGGWMAKPRSTQTNFVGIITYAIHCFSRLSFSYCCRFSYGETDSVKCQATYSFLPRVLLHGSIVWSSNLDQRVERHYNYKCLLRSFGATHKNASAMAILVHSCECQ